MALNQPTLTPVPCCAGGAAQPSSSASASDLSPSFLWLLRDFQFQLNEDGRQVRRQRGKRSRRGC